MLFGNRLLDVAIISCFIAQFYKVFSPILKGEKIQWARLIQTGGMPSSHSAVVAGLATLVGKYQGVDTPIFAVAFIMAIVVMYDACGVRRAAGKQAALLNKLVETPGLTGIQVSERLVEVLGHTPIQVFVGALIGVVVGLIA